MALQRTYFLRAMLHHCDNGGWQPPRLNKSRWQSPIRHGTCLLRYRRICSADPLDSRRPGIGYLDVLVGDDSQPAADDFQQLAGLQEERRIGRPAIALVAG